jgi:nucleotidyltransferase/DNA polymerase involved in DNA repair
MSRHVEKFGTFYKLTFRNVEKELFGSDGEWLYLLCRGISSEEIRERSALQSITASKNFQTHILKQELLLKWIWTLIGELTIRVGVDVGENHRLPSSMTVFLSMFII